MNQKPIFKSEEGYKAIMAAYDEILSHWPVANEKRMIKTKYGQTHVIECGQKSAPAMLLIHGSASNSATWMGDVPVLCEKYHVFVIDVPGEPGKSEAIRHGLDGEAYAEWLKELMDGLSIEKATIWGLSLGGFMALKFATHYPERVLNLVLTSTSGVGPQRLSLIFKILPYLFMGPKGAIKIMKIINGGEPIPEEAIHFSLMVNSQFNPVMTIPLIVDADLRKLTMPVLYIAGLKDALLNTPAAIKRFDSLLPKLTKRIYPEKGHLVLNQTREVLSFLEKCS